MQITDEKGSGQGGGGPQRSALGWDWSLGHWQFTSPDLAAQRARLTKSRPCRNCLHALQPAFPELFPEVGGLGGIRLAAPETALLRSPMSHQSPVTNTQQRQKAERVSEAS
jgi:hypothetical protein